MLSRPERDGLLDAVLDDRLVDQRQHLLRLRLGGGQEPRAEPGGGKDGFPNGFAHGVILAAGCAVSHDEHVQYAQATSMLDPAFVRDYIEEVRAGLRSRGLDPRPRCRSWRRSRPRRRRIIPEVEGLKRQQNTAGERGGARQARGRGRTALLEGNKAARAAHQAAAGRARRDRMRRLDALLMAAEPAARQRAGGRERRRQRRGAPARRAARVRLRAAAALGPRPGARHPRLRARRADVGRALRGADGRRRAALAGAHQLHARPAHPRARLYARSSRRSSSTAPRSPAPATCRSSRPICSRSPASGICSSCRPPKCR